MKKIILYLFVLQSLFSCKEEKKTDYKITTSIDTLDEVIVKTPLLIEKSFFPVYNLSKNTTAIVVNLDESKIKTKFDEIFEYVQSKDSLYNVLYGPNSNKVKNYDYYDTLGAFKLIKNKLLETEIKKVIKEQYYVYGTKGFSQMKVKDIVCGLDECRTNIIAFTIKNYDTIKNGKPIFCSSQLLNLNYGEEYSEIEQKIEQFNNSKIYDYTDSISTKVFANSGSTYFSYRDDFEWGTHPTTSKCKFPTRSIYKIGDEDIDVELFWGDGLDLFGIPCD